MPELNRRSFLKTTGVGLATALAQARTTQADVKAVKPNVLMIVVDDLGYGALSCYGAKDLRTPNIAALAASGMRFTPTTCWSKSACMVSRPVKKLVK